LKELKYLKKERIRKILDLDGYKVVGVYQRIRKYD
jgi:hypothetical protein